jgi:hypothetical protein
MPSFSSKHSSFEHSLLSKLFPHPLRHLLNNRKTHQQSPHPTQTSHSQVQAAVGLP